MKLKLYSRTNCPPCQAVEDCLDELKVKYERVDVRQLENFSKPVPLLVATVNGIDIEKTGYKSDEDIKNWLAYNRFKQ